VRRRTASDESTPDSAGGQSAGMTEESVRGERGAPSVDLARSMQSRVSSVMACGLMIILGAGLLTWYYSNAFSRRDRERRAAKVAESSRAEGEMSLPALERIELARTDSAGAINRWSGDGRSPPSGVDARSQPTQLPLTQSIAAYPASGPYPGMITAYGTGVAPYSGLPQKSPAQLAKERLLSGTAFARASEPGMISAAGMDFAVPEAAPGTSQPGAPLLGGPAQSTGLAGPAGIGAPVPNTTSRSDGAIATLLRSAATASATAQVLPTQRFLLPKGAFIDCTLETAIDSTLPGMTTCITATDTFGVDGDVVLLERGTKLIGETRGQVQQGSARVFVLWTEARTPRGIVVPLDSPGTDELGRSGLAGQADRHFWDRFGAAILISTLDGAVQAAVQSASRGSGTVIYNPSSSESIVTDVLKSTVEIPPTVTKRNGDRIQVFVARDVDFRSVYELRATATAH
jgi:type IV secretion system protein VirB10